MHHLTRLSLAYPKLTLAILAAITLAFGAGLPNLRTEFGYRVLVGDDHPSIQALDDLVAQFGGGMPIQIVWDCSEIAACENVFDGASLEMAEVLTRGLSSAEGVRRVVGPANAPLLVPSQVGFDVRRFVEAGKVVIDSAYLADLAVEDAHWVGSIITRDGLSGVISVQTTDTRSATNERVVDEIERALAPFREVGFKFYLAGDPIGTVVSGRELARSSAQLIPFTVLVIGGVVFLLSGSIAHTCAALVTMGIALLWTFGLLGWLDWPQDGILEVLAPFILVIGVCDAMHVLSRQSAEVRNGHDSRTALLRATTDVGASCMLTSLTTGLALLSFATSALATFVRFGVISAFGTMTCLVLTFSLLPLISRNVNYGGMEGRSREWDAAMKTIVGVSRSWARPIVVASLIAVTTFGLLWSNFLRVDTDWYESFGEDSTVMRWVRAVEDRLGPRDSLELVLTLPPSTGLEEPETLRRISELERGISASGLAVEPGLVEIIKRVNRLVHDNDPAFETLGRTRNANAELLETLALESGVLSSWMSLDRSKIRVPVYVPEQSYAMDREVIEKVSDVAGQILPADWGLSMSGEVEMTAAWIQAVQATQLRSFPAAALLVLGSLTIFFRSFRLGLASLLPTLLPVVVTLGSMALLGMSLDVGRAMIAAILLGIGVDDAIHLLSQYKRRRDEGSAPDAAITLALQHAGRAVVTTSVALSLGFLTLMASAWQTISSFGFFVALSIMGALASTLFVLPALIFTFSKKETTS